MPYVRSPVSEEKSVLQAAPQRLLQFTSENQCMSVVCRVFQVPGSGLDFFWRIEGQCRKKQDTDPNPDPSVRGMDPDTYHNVMDP